MTKEDIVKLTERILANKASDEEIALYNHWFNKVIKNGQSEVINDADKEAELLNGIYAEIKIGKTHKLLRKVKYVGAAAAVLLFIVGITYYFLYFKNNKYQAREFVTVNKEITPGKNQAVLTLSNGSRVELDKSDIGQIAQQAGTSVMKSESGLLSYRTDQHSIRQTNDVQLNTLSTPRGGQYKIILPDGTKVWLNSASSIRFPVSFDVSAERDVTISGEVYFEVVHNALSPFIVSTENIKVKVLGTHFDVNTYGDNEAIKTTLLQGSVKISRGNQNVLIVPGEQANVSANRDNISVKKVDAESVIAWTQGFLSLEDNDVKEFMSNISRWYDVDVEYKGKIPDNAGIGGLINRNSNLSDVLSALEAGGIHTRVEGRKIIVSP